MSQPGQDPASDRNALAEDRNLLAIERTFAAWLRTGLGGLAVGVAFERLFPDTDPVWISKAGATCLITLAIGIFLFSLREYLRALRRLDPHTLPKLPVAIPVILVALAAAAAVIAGMVLWFF
ncbi:MAG: DUF202 domain-containing protein [Rhodospirillales bacterium]|nr:DUF202 domain-containing protein [Rhodospirillales bacterium]